MSQDPDRSRWHHSCNLTAIAVSPSFNWPGSETRPDSTQGEVFNVWRGRDFYGAQVAKICQINSISRLHLYQSTSINSLWVPKIKFGLHQLTCICWISFCFSPGQSWLCLREKPMLMEFHCFANCGLQGPYGVFAGKDATRYFAKQLVSLEDDDGQPLTSEERMVFVPRWMNRFVSKQCAHRLASFWGSKFLIISVPMKQSVSRFFSLMNTSKMAHRHDWRVLPRRNWTTWRAGKSVLAGLLWTYRQRSHENLIWKGCVCCVFAGCNFRYVCAAQVSEIQVWCCWHAGGMKL